MESDRAFMLVYQCDLLIEPRLVLPVAVREEKIDVLLGIVR